MPRKLTPSTSKRIRPGVTGATHPAGSPLPLPIRTSAGKKADLKELVNLSITQTLTRSIYTSFTTFITIFVVFVMGVSSIREFALPIMVGIVCGAYSSVCITGALWYVLKTKVGKRAK